MKNFAIVVKMYGGEKKKKVKKKKKRPGNYTTHISFFSCLLFRFCFLFSPSPHTQHTPKLSWSGWKYFKPYICPCCLFFILKNISSGHNSGVFLFFRWKTGCLSSQNGIRKKQKYFLFILYTQLAYVHLSSLKGKRGKEHNRKKKERERERGKLEEMRKKK